MCSTYIIFHSLYTKYNLYFFMHNIISWMIKLKFIINFNIIILVYIHIYKSVLPYRKILWSIVFLMCTLKSETLSRYIKNIIFNVKILTWKLNIKHKIFACKYSKNNYNYITETIKISYYHFLSLRNYKKKIECESIT